MKTFKTKTSSTNEFVSKSEIVDQLGHYGIDLEGVNFNIVENHREAYGYGQYQIIEVTEDFYLKNEKNIKSYLEQ